MALPISYNLRNLRQRPGATVMTGLGIALTVTTALFIMMLLVGLRQAFLSTGEPLNLLVMRKGSETELSSVVTRGEALRLQNLAGVATGAGGRPLASGEIALAIVLPRPNGVEVNVSVRGLSAAGREMRPSVRLVAGRWFRSGQREVAVSTVVARRFAHAQLGDELAFGKGAWRVVGIFDAAGTAYASEIWANVDQVAADFDRPVYSVELLRARDLAARERLLRRVGEDQSLALEARPEPDYYANQTRSGIGIEILGTLVAIIMAVGASFAAMNTMYAAVAQRGREIATLRILGFSRASILASFVFESVVLALAGGVVGILMMLPFIGVSAGTFNALTFSEMVFTMQLTPALAAGALLFAVVMGALGGAAPAWQAARQEILAGLRD
ncbi:MAG TPA: FtsX-like permease family protein [Terriglobales bacterium]|nr:FtsX-like permease family protein [Terriglobales bacterium]